MQISSVNGNQLEAFNGLIHSLGVQGAEPSFLDMTLNADLVHHQSNSAGVSLAHYASFVTLHFPPDADTLAIAAQIRQLPEVEHAVAVPVAIPPSFADPLVGTSDQVVRTAGVENQWYLFRCRVDKAWELARGKEVVIADVDFGCRATHQDLTNIDATYNSVDGSGDVGAGDEINHGTAVLAQAGAPLNGQGMSGVAPEARLWAVQSNVGKAAGVEGSPWARAVEWVRSRNADGRRKVLIVEAQTAARRNIEQVPSINAAIRTAIADGVVVCVAAGNGPFDAGLDDHGKCIPFTGSILVGATWYDPAVNSATYWSNFGDRVIVAAPGDPRHDISAGGGANDEYSNMFGGTSGATPKVAGVSALMLSVNPKLSHGQVRQILAETGTQVTNDNPSQPIGTFLDALAAVEKAGATEGAYIADQRRRER